jgi:hypothetical protein
MGGSEGQVLMVDSTINVGSVSTLVRAEEGFALLREGARIRACERMDSPLEAQKSLRL